MNRIFSIALVALCACTAAADGHAEWTLADRRAVTGLSPGRDAYVVLVMDPQDVFTCAGTLTEWLEWRRQAPERFRLVFARAPSAAERRRLSAVRLPLEGTLATAPSDSTPIEMLVSDRRIVHVERGVRMAEQSRLLDPLRVVPIEVLVTRMEKDGPESLSHGGLP
jgi:hypothetical protein